uniref:A-kinase anchor protein 9 n=1 Tax=Bursaphelenchus xylophilus TaxID=6326 RepID=A0A1I7SEC7_BURXY
MIEWVQDKLRNLRQHEAESLSELTSPKSGTGRRHRSLEALDRIEEISFSRPSTSGVQRPATAGHRRVEMEEDLEELDPHGRLPIYYGRTYRGINEDLRRQFEKDDAAREKLVESMSSMMSQQLWSVLNANTNLQQQLKEVQNNCSRLQAEKIGLEDKKRHLEHENQVQLQAWNLKLRELRFEVQSIQKMMKTLNDDALRFKSNPALPFMFEGIKTMIEGFVNQRTSQIFDAEQVRAEVLKQYEMVMQKNSELENEKLDGHRRNLSLESQLKHISEQKERVDDAIRRIIKLPNIGNSVSGDDVDSNPHDVVRAVRTTLNRLEDQLETVETRAGSEKRRADGLESQLKTALADKKSIEKQLQTEQQTKTRLESDLSEKEKLLKKLKERVNSLEIDKEGLRFTISDLNKKLEEERGSFQRQMTEQRRRLETEWNSRQNKITDEIGEIEKRADERVNTQRQITEETRAELQKVQLQLVDANVEVNALKREIQQLQTDLSNAKKVQKTHEERINSLKEELETKEITIAALDRELNEQNEMIKKQEEHIDQLSRENANFQAEKLESNETITRLRTEILETKTLSDQEVSTYKAKALESTENAKKVSQLEKELKKSKAEAEMFSGQYEKITTRLEVIETENTQKSTELWNNQLALQDLEQRFQDIWVENESLRSENRSTLAMLNEEQMRNKAYNKRIVEVETELSRQNMDFDAFHKNEIELKSQLRELAGQRDALAEELEEQRNQFLNAKSQLQKQLEKARTDVSEDSEKKIIDLQTKLDSLQNLKERLCIDLNETSLQLKQAKETIHEKDLHISEISSGFNFQFNQLKSKNSELKKDVNDLTQALDHERADHDEKLARLRREHDQNVQELYEKLRRSDENRERAEENANDLRERLLDVEARNKKAAELVLELRKQLDELNEEKESLSARLSEEENSFRNQLSDVSSKNKTLETRLYDSEHRVQDLEKALEASESKYSRQTEKNSLLELRYDQLEKEILRVREENNRMEERLKDSYNQLSELGKLKEKLQNEVNEKTKEINSVVDELSLSKRDLKSLNVRIDELNRVSEQQKQAYNNVVQEKHTIERQLVETRSELTSISTTIREVETSSANQSELLKEAQERAEFLERECDKRTKELEEICVKIEKTEKEMVQKTSLIKRLESEIKAKNEEHRIATKELEVFKSETKKDNQKLENAERENHQLKGDLNVLKGKLNELQDNWTDLERYARRVGSLAAHTSHRSRSPSPHHADSTIISSDLEVEERPIDSRSTSMLLMNAREIIEILEETRITVEQKLKHNGEERNQLELRIAKQEAELKQIKMELERREMDGKSKIQETESALEELSSLRMRLISLQASQKQHENDLKNKENEAAHLKNQFLSSEMARKEATGRLNAAFDELDRLKKLVFECEVREGRLKETIQKLQDRVDTAESSQNRLRQVVEDSQRENQRLVDLNKTLVEQSQTVEKEAQEIRERLQSQQHELNKISNEYNEMKEDYRSMERENKRMIQKLNDSKRIDDNVKVLKIDNERLITDLKRMDENSDRLRRELDDAQQRLKRSEIRYNELFNQLKQEKNDNQNLVNRINYFEKKERELQHEVNDLRAQNDRLLVEKVDQQRDLEETRKKRHEIQVELSEYKNQMHRNQLELDALTQSKKLIHEELRRKEAALREVLAEKGQIGQALNQQEREMSKWKQTCESLERRMNELLDDNTKKVQARRKDEQERQIQRAVKAKEEQLLKQHDRTIQGLLQRCKELEKYSEDVKSELENVRSERSQLMIRLQRLQHEPSLSRAESNTSLTRGSPPDQREMVVRRTFTSTRSATVTRNQSEASQNLQLTPVTRQKKYF